MPQASAQALDVDAKKSSSSGALDWQYSGALVFLKFEFWHFIPDEYASFAFVTA